jgi:hypothetical protein
MLPGGEWFLQFAVIQDEWSFKSSAADVHNRDLARLAGVLEILFSVVAHQLAFMTADRAFDDRLGSKNRGSAYLGWTHALNTTPLRPCCNTNLNHARAEIWIDRKFATLIPKERRRLCDGALIVLLGLLLIHG